MKITLISPTQSTVYNVRMIPAYPPMGILYVAAVLENEGHDVEFIDMDIENWSWYHLTAYLIAHPPDVVGITAVTSTIDAAWAIAEAVKVNLPDTYVMIGGAHATMHPKETLDHAWVDAVVVGEAETAILDIIDGRDPGIVHCGKEPVNDIPFPALHLAKIDRYRPPDAHDLPAYPIMTSRGCPYYCTYCCRVLGNRFRGRSAENVVNEIHLRVAQGAKEIHFLDDNISQSKARILNLCQRLYEENFPVRYEISNGVRADCVDQEVLEAFRKIGMVNIGFGVESGSERTLHHIKKGCSKDQVRKSMIMAKSMGFETWGFFVIGFLGETREDIEATIEFALELDPTFIKFFVLHPTPGTEAYRELDEAGLIDDYDYSKVGIYRKPVHHLPDISAADLERYRRQANRRFYLRPRKIWQLLRRIDSWDRLMASWNGGKLILSNILGR